MTEHEEMLARVHGTLDAAKVTSGPELSAVARVDLLVKERDDSYAALADFEEETDTHAALNDMKARAEAAEAKLREGVQPDGGNRAKAELKQIKEDLQAMGRLSKLAFSLVMGDEDPEDVEAGDDDE